MAAHIGTAYAYRARLLHDGRGHGDGEEAQLARGELRALDLQMHIRIRAAFTNKYANINVCLDLRGASATAPRPRRAGGRAARDNRAAQDNRAARDNCAARDNGTTRTACGSLESSAPEPTVK